MASNRNYEIPSRPSSHHTLVAGVDTTVSGVTRAQYRRSNSVKRKKPSTRFIAPTSYTMEEKRDGTAYGSIVRYRKSDRKVLNYWVGNLNSTVGTGEQWFGNMISAKVLSLTWNVPPAGLSEEAMAKAWSALKNQRVNFGQAYAERKQTADLVVQSCDRIVHNIIDIKRRLRDPKKLARYANAVVSDLPNWFLEVVFGWKPLISDIHGALAELDSRDRSDWKVTAKGKAARKEAGSLLFQKPSAPQSSALYDAEIFHGAYTRIDAVPDNAALQKAASLGLTNPLSLAWEVMPWSFAIDWFYPIGPYFDRLDAALGWNILGMSTSTLTKSRINARGLDYSPPGGEAFTAGWSSGLRFVKLARGAGYQGPSEVFPHLKDPFHSAQRVGTALSLLFQAKRGFRIPW